MRLGRVGIVWALVSLGVLSLAGNALACSCVELKPRQAMRQADAVIVGRLIEVVPRDEYTSEFRYEVRRAYKGGGAVATGKTVSVSSASMGSACGLPTELERHYGLFLSRREGEWRGSSCAAMSPRKLAAAMRGRGDGKSSQAHCAS